MLKNFLKFVKRYFLEKFLNFLLFFIYLYVILFFIWLPYRKENIPLKEKGKE